MTVVHNDAHIHELFLKLSVGLGLGLVFLCVSAFCLFSGLAWTVLFLCCYGRPM